MARIYHPHYEVFRDRKTGVEFKPALLEGRTVAAAEVEDPAPFLGRGFVLWPADEPLAREPGEGAEGLEPGGDAGGAGDGQGASAAGTPGGAQDTPAGQGGGDQEPNRESEAVPTPWDEMTKAQIAEYVAQFGVVIDAKDTKAEIIAYVESQGIKPPAPTATKE